MANFSSLPPELVLYLGEFLCARDHLNYALSSRDMWNVCQNQVSANKRKITYWSITGDATDLDRLTDIYDDPSILDVVTVLTLENAVNQLDLRQQKAGSVRIPLDDIEVADIVLDCTTKHSLQAFLKIRNRLFPKILFPLFTPNLEFLHLCTGEAVQQLLTTVYPPFCERGLQLLFPRLSHLSIVPRDKNHFPATFYDLVMLARLPTLRTLKARNTSGTQALDVEHIAPSQLKQLELLATIIPAIEVWPRLFGSVLALERLHYTRYRYDFHNYSIHMGRAIIDALSHSTSMKSLVSLILDDFYDYAPRVRLPCPSLRGFVSLRVLKCKWRTLIPSLVQIGSEHPEIRTQCRKLDLWTQQAEDHDCSYEVAEQIFSEIAHHVPRLEDVLPVSLRNFTLDVCVLPELYHLTCYSNSVSFGRLHTFYFSTARTRFPFDNATAVEHIMQNVKSANVPFEDGCVLYENGLVKDQTDKYVSL